jgi:hypothetical protein
MKAKTRRTEEAAMVFAIRYPCGEPAHTERFLFQSGQPDAGGQFTLAVRKLTDSPSGYRTREDVARLFAGYGFTEVQL